jgi:hypothetical protein
MHSFSGQFHWHRHIQKNPLNVVSNHFDLKNSSLTITIQCVKVDSYFNTFVLKFITYAFELERVQKRTILFHDFMDILIRKHSSSQITMIEKACFAFLTKKTNVFGYATIVQMLCGFFSFFMTIIVVNVQIMKGQAASFATTFLLLKFHKALIGQ